MVDDAREITTQQAEAYQATGRKVKTPKPAKGKTKIAQLTAASKPSAQSAIERIYIRLVDSNDQSTLLSLKQTIDTHRGDTEVVLVLGEASSKQAIKLPGGIDKESTGMHTLRELVGVDNLVVR